MIHTSLLPTPDEVKALFPLKAETASFIRKSRETAREILNGKEKRKALIVGPCSIHDRTSALEYAERFKELSVRVEDSCFLVMRFYIEKPRTSMGWKGMLYDPYLDGSCDMHTGLLWTREMLLALAEKEIPCATEFVDPLASLYFQDLITWGFIGARTSASQPHRQLASALHMPVGFKNSTDGNLDEAILGTLSAHCSHVFMNVDGQGKLAQWQSGGNPSTHLVLRGAQDYSNYDVDSVLLAQSKLRQHHLPPRLMIDCSHGNCYKKEELQPLAFYSVLEQIEKGNEAIFGLMLESHLEKGNQSLVEDPSTLKYAVSITDPCIDWKMTEELILAADHSFSVACSSPMVINLTQS
jgi:3-deoxy-7-phosphoheptulonate synthase